MDKRDDQQEPVEISASKVRVSGGEQKTGGFFDTVLGGILDIFSEEDEPAESNDQPTVVVNEVEIIDSEGNVYRSKGGKVNDSNVHMQGQKQSAFEKIKRKFRK